jgi:carbamate kinase
MTARPSELVVTKSAGPQVGSPEVAEAGAASRLCKMNRLLVTVVPGSTGWGGVPAVSW